MPTAYQPESGVAPDWPLKWATQSLALWARMLYQPGVIIVLTFTITFNCLDYLEETEMKSIKYRLAVIIMGIIISTVSITACGGSKTVQNTNTQTYGQEMMDLKKAFDEGAITEKEYNDAKKAITKKYK